MPSDFPLQTLLTLLALPGVSGDEGAAADFLQTEIAATVPDTAFARVGDNLLAFRGSPQTAIFAHTDTIGFTLGYDKVLIPIGSPDAQDGDKLRCGGLTGKMRKARDGGRGAHLRQVRDADGKKGDPLPGSRWVYANAPRVKNDVITAPYLDDRAGVWCALNALARSPHCAVAFCVGEEQHGHGARVCAEHLYRERGITQALIADITWHTKHTPCGKGVVISLRDAFPPRQVFLDRVLALASASEIPHQREIQSAGSSDGGHILRSSVPMDWVFVGAPEKRPHTAREQAHLSDLNAMTDLLTYLVNRL